MSEDHAVILFKDEELTHIIKRSVLDDTSSWEVGSVVDVPWGKGKKRQS